MAEYGASEGFNYVVEQFHQVMQKGVELVGKGIGASVSGLGALLAAIPGLGAIGEGVMAMGARGTRDDMDPQHQTTITASATPVRAKSVENDYEPVNATLRDRAIAITPTALASNMQEASYNPVGGYKPDPGLPNLVGPSRGAGMSMTV
jgi:hypothetical protein